MSYSGRPEFRIATPYGHNQKNCLNCIFLQQDQHGYYCGRNAMKIMSPAHYRCPSFTMSQTFDSIKAEVDFLNAKQLEEKRHRLMPRRPIITKNPTPSIKLKRKGL